MTEVEEDEEEEPEEEEEEAGDGDGNENESGKLAPPSPLPFPPIPPIPPFPPFLKSIGRYKKSNLPLTPGVACSVSSSARCERRLGTFLSISVVRGGVEE
jgi:hypothetical protein